ncbi:MAG: stage V sporulation protein D [Bacilli bacterium]|nr:stage V sporulation protein D [Bacilli bacterium]
MVIKQINNRIKVVLLIIFVISMILIIKVFYIEVFSYQKLHKLANDLWSRNLPITADRGLIMDRNGKVLAGNITKTTLVLIPNQIKNKEEVTKNLARILDVSYDEMKKHVFKNTSIERVHPDGRRLDFTVADQINSLNYDGVYLLKESVRNYPYNNLLSHVLGFTGIDNQGLSGLELLYDDYLKGVDGSIKYYSDGKGARLTHPEVYNEPVNGMNLYLTIDIDIQASIERELDNVIAKYNPEHALIIVEDPNTGEILGMASRPNFNPNYYQNYKSEVINRNLPIWMTFEPGSTFKIITLAAAIEEGKVNLFEDHYYDTGSIRVANAKIKCWKPGGHGYESFLNVVENSCNPGFVVLGERLGKETLFRYINAFGFGSKTNIDLNGEEDGILFNLDKVGPVELATTAFGQGISVTPIQQINAVSAVINGGNLLKPYVIKMVVDPVSNNILYENKKTLIKDHIISENTSKLVKFALESVVANGTGRNAYLENYRVGGKTGTAQKVENGHYLYGNYILSFMGFMPADKPEVVVYVAIDNPKGVIQYGGTVSAPVAKNVLQDIASILKMDKDISGMPKVYNWYESKYVILPDVTGLSKDEALKKLKGFSISYVGSGSSIINQNPVGNSYVLEGSNVKLMLN